MSIRTRLVISPRRIYIVFGCLLSALAALLVLSLAVGSVSLPLGGVWSALVAPGSVERSDAVIVWQFRLPKTLTAGLTGAGLAVSGLLMQSLFRNPIAGPYVLGVSSGASLGVAVLILAGGSLGWAGSAFGTVGAAAIGAGAVLLLALSAAARVRDYVALLIVGLMLGSLSGAAVSVLQYFSASEKVKTYALWTMGSLEAVTWERMPWLAGLTLAGLGGAFLLQKPLDALLLGERYAQSMGVDVKRARLWLILAASALASAATAFCGPIAFVGVTAPHVARMAFRSSAHRTLVPGAALLGACFLLACDLLARLPGMGQTLPINAVTSLVGAPLVIWIVLKRKGL